MKKNFAFVLLLISIVSIISVSGCTDVYVDEKIAKYTSGKIEEPSLSYDPPSYSFTPKQYDNE
ncbi:MAG: hypothetical protein KAW40_05890, partial [Candidatus Aenigmarchaeota archaeon]|nr:hypothetical protein [Candidatus Aenigmarchaeota archaeon]